jgi:hypothetical protein
MTDNKFIISLFIAIVYFLLKLVEQRMILKEAKPLKILTRDTFIVYISCIATLFIYEQITPLTDTNNVPNVFVNDPDF